MNLCIANSDISLRWKEKDYKVVTAEIVDGAPNAEVLPRNADLEREICQRLIADQNLSVYLRGGYCVLVGADEAA